MEPIERIIKLSDELENNTISIRRRIHRNPETAFEEYETSELVAKELKRMGIPYEKSPVEPGIVACIDSGRPGKLLMLRADMDALPIGEETELPFKSEKEGTMHACGHDVHTANLLAVGEILSRMKDFWSGRVKLVFQPGEERGGGGRRMIEQGLMDELPDACFGLHVNPTEPGQFLIGTGYLTSYSDGCHITVHGKAAHSSAPQDGVDAIQIAANIVMALNTIVSRNISPMQQSTLNVGRISGGRAGNIVADRAELFCMMRNAREETREVMFRQIREICAGIAAATGGTCNVDINPGYPAIYNDGPLTEFVTSLMGKYTTELYGGIMEQIPEPAVLTGNRQALTAEDFGFYSRKAPSCYLQLGTGNFAPAHSGQFMVDETYIKLATRAMALAAYEFLS